MQKLVYSKDKKQTNISRQVSLRSGKTSIRSHGYHRFQCELQTGFFNSEWGKGISLKSTTNIVTFYSLMLFAIYSF